MRAMARSGYAANGLVHLLIGVIVIVVAFGGRGQTDQAGALQTLTDLPFGIFLLWLVAATLAALGLWQLLQLVLVRGGDLDAWGRRAQAAGPAAVYLALTGIALSVALGARSDGDKTAQEVSSWLFETPGGVFVLASVGIGVGAAGVSFVVIGVRRSFDKKVRIPSGAMGTAVTISGAAGYVGKGLAITALGVLLLVAAFRQEARATGGLDAAVQALREQMFGPLLVFVVGLGLVMYAVFCFLRARYAKL
jgi:hypothetical protein